MRFGLRRCMCSMLSWDSPYSEWETKSADGFQDSVFDTLAITVDMLSNVNDLNEVEGIAETLMSLAASIKHQNLEQEERFLEGFFLTWPMS